VLHWVVRITWILNRLSDGRYTGKHVTRYSASHWHFHRVFSGILHSILNKRRAVAAQTARYSSKILSIQYVIILGPIKGSGREDKSFAEKSDKKAVLSQRQPRNAPYTWVPWQFSGFLTTPTATIPNIFHGLMCRSTLWMFLQNLKSVALPAPEIIGGTPKNLGSPWIRQRFLFSKMFNRLLFGLALYIYPPNLKSVTLPVREIRGSS